jgi:Ca-activated chloride channel family protein
MTRLDEGTLQKIALETGGAYVPVTGGAQGVDHIAGLISDMEERAFEAGMYKLYEDRFLAFLIPGMVLLALEFFAGDLVGRRRS